MQDYTYTFKHLPGVENKIANVLSRQFCFLKQLSVEIVGFERIKEEYESFYVLKEGVTLEIDGFLRMAIYFNFINYAFFILP